MRILRGKLVVIGLVIIAIATVVEIFLSDARRDVWEKFKDKNDDNLGQMDDGDDIVSFEQYCAKFGKSYKNQETYSKRKKEF